MATKTKITYETFMVLETCCKCGTPFGLSTELYDSFQESGETFYCPNGHGQVYTAHKNLEQQLADTRAKLASEQEAREWYAGKLKDTENSLRATRAAHTRTKNRVRHGVCPCCNRQFENLQRHMTTQHPEFE